MPTQRVTQSMMNTQMMRNLNNNLRRMDTTQNQLATGMRINKPSDDPVGISFSLRYRSEISLNDQYQKNVDSALSWLEYADKMLDQAGNVMQRARELAVYGSNGTNPQQALDAMASEVDQLYDQMLSIGNSKFNGKYVFNGEKTDLIPYKSDTAGSDITDDGKIMFEIGVGVKMAVNVTGNEVFGEPDMMNNIFTTLKGLSSSLRSGKQEGIAKAIEMIDQRMDTFLAIRADVGAKTNRIELAQDRLQDININLSGLQSKTEDADIAAVIMNLKMDENVYQASLSAGSRIIRPSLLDFLR